MTYQETLALYARHRDAPWWPYHVHCPDQIFGSTESGRYSSVWNENVAILALRGSLLEWLIHNNGKEEIGCSANMEWYICGGGPFQSIDSALIAAYESIAAK